MKNKPKLILFGIIVFALFEVCSIANLIQCHDWPEVVLLSIMTIFIVVSVMADEQHDSIRFRRFCGLFDHINSAEYSYSDLLEDPIAKDFLRFFTVSNDLDISADKIKLIPLLDTEFIKEHHLLQRRHVILARIEKKPE